MILDCPHCGFSGRLPEHAIPTAHRARCPRCRLGFDIDAAASSDKAPPAGPNDSSYQLDPIVAGFDDSRDGEWSNDADWPRPSTIGSPRPVPAAVPAGLGRFPRPGTIRIRLFQAWALAFLLAAAAIGARTVVAVVRFDDARFFSAELLHPVAAVVLLVGASALLCLSVDLGRRLARSATPAANRPSAPLASRSRSE